MNGMHVAVGPHTYKITSDIDSDALLDAENEVGRCTPHTCTILIHTQATLSMQRDAVVHELLHVIWYQSGLTAAKRITEEQAVLAITTPLLEVLQANPQLVSFLVD